MIDHERKRALQLAQEIEEGPDKTRRDEEYWTSWSHKFLEYSKLVSPKEVAWLIRQYENENQMRDIGLENDPRSETTKYLVEANPFELNALYDVWSRKFTWEQDNRMGLPTVAYIRGRPITISLTWVRIAGELVCFWDPVTPLVDYDIIKSWFSLAFPKVDQKNDDFYTDARGFSHAINRIKQFLDGKKGLEKLKEMGRS